MPPPATRWWPATPWWRRTACTPPPAHRARPARLPLALAGLGLAIAAAGAGPIAQRPARRSPSAPWPALWLLLAGLAGLFMLALWTLTAHVAGWANANLLLFNPLAFVLLAAVWRRRVSRRAHAVAWIVAVLAAAGAGRQPHACPAQHNLPWILLALPVWLALLHVLRRRSKRLIRLTPRRPALRSCRAGEASWPHARTVLTATASGRDPHQPVVNCVAYHRDGQRLGDIALERIGEALEDAGRLRLGRPARARRGPAGTPAGRVRPARPGHRGRPLRAPAHQDRDLRRLAVHRGADRPAAARAASPSARPTSSSARAT